MQKQVLSVKLDVNLYHQLKSEVGQGKISRFVESLIAKELNKQDQKLAKEYQEAAQDRKRWKEAQEWETVQMVDWNKQDGGEDN